MATPHPNTQAAIDAIKTNESVSDAVALVKYMSDRVHGVLIDSSPDTAHDTFFGQVENEKRSPNPAKQKQVTDIFSRIGIKINDSKTNSTKKVLPIAEINSVKTEIGKLWQAPLNATVAAHDASTNVDSFIIKAIGFYHTIESIKESADWSKLSPVVKSATNRDNELSVEINVPKDGVMVKVKNSPHLSFGPLNAGKQTIQIPEALQGKAGSPITKELIYIDPDDESNPYDKAPALRWDIKEKGLDLATPEVTVPVFHVGDGDTSITLDNPIPESTVEIEELSEDGTTSIKKYPSIPIPKNQSTTKTIKLPGFDISKPKKGKFRVTYKDTRPGADKPADIPNTFDLDVRSKQLNEHELNVDDTIAIKEGEIPALSIKKGSAYNKIEAKVGATTLKLDRDLLKGGNESLKIKTTDANTLTALGNLVPTVSPIIIQVTITDDDGHTREVDVKLTINSKKPPKPEVHEKTFTVGEKGVKLPVDNTKPGTMLKVYDGTSLICSVPAHTQGSSTEIALPSNFTQNAKKYTDIKVVAIEGSEKSDESDSKELIIKMDLDKLTIPKTDIDVKFGTKKPKIQINGGTIGAKLIGENNVDLGTILNNGDYSHELDLDTDKTATDPEYKANTPGEYKCSLKIKDEFSGNIKTINLNFKVKPRELMLTTSPIIDPSTIKTQIGKTDALSYTVKGVQPGEEIVVKGPNGYEYIEKVPDGLTITPPATSVDYPIALSGLDTAEKGVKQLTFMRRDPNDHTKCSPVGRASYEVKDKDNLKIKEDINKPKVGKVEVEHNATEVIATLENPVPGSKVTIAGGGITKTVIVPHNHPEVTPATTPPTYASLEIKLDGFPTKEADKITNMTVTVSDPSDENIKNTSAFDVEVGHDHLHEDHTYRLDEQSLRNAKSGQKYTIYQDGKAETYNVSSSKRWLGFGWKAQVPVLKGEEPKNITARTKTQLIEAVRAHCKDLEKRAHAKSHGDHEDHGNESHDKKEHKEGGDHEKIEKKEGESHDKKEGHSEDHAESPSTEKKGFFKRIGGWIDAPFKWAWKYTPKFIKVPLAGTAKVIKDSVITGGVLGAGSSLLGVAGLSTASAFTAGLIVPGMLGAAAISSVYRLMKVTGWAKKLGIEGSGKDGGGDDHSHAHAPAGDHAPKPHA